MFPDPPVFSSRIMSPFLARNFYTFGMPSDVDFLPLQIPTNYFLKISLELERFVLLWWSAAILIQILSWRRQVGCCPQKIGQGMVKASMAPWPVPCGAGLGVVLSCWASGCCCESGELLFIFCKRVLSLCLAAVASLCLTLQGFPSRSVTVLCFFYVCLPCRVKCTLSFMW